MPTDGRGRDRRTGDDDAERLRALLVPSGPLPTGRYRLVPALSRTRWDTTEAADELNTYQQQADVVLEM
ncbi:hypothetical protein [Actinotalea sp. Marseille-Q4924]|uniref:hypothetical protein n=1 Tax=Actinotalea sp. Marseille-Q4924 TaxID=2866571 RepID=UPI001CE45052|nr:hypothetical protein [Actinotalea sp. Marseille-Q4924]